MTRTTEAVQPPRAPAAADKGMGRRLTLVLLAMLWPAQMLTAAGVFTSMSQGAIAQHFQTTQIVWFSTVYSLVVALATPFVAKAGDLFGRKRVMLVIIAAGLVGDLVAVLAPTYEVMLAGRAIAGLYGPIAALVYASARDAFPPRHVGTATGLIGSSAGIVLVVCPLAGGWLLDHAGFQGVLWALAGAIALGLLLVWLFVPGIPPTEERVHFDWWGGLLLGGSATVLIYALGQGGTWGWTDPRLLGLVAASVVLAALFVVVERRVTEPLLDVRMLARPGVSTVLAGSSLAQGAFFTAGGMIVFVALYPAIPGVSSGLGWSGTHTALVGTPAGVLVILTGIAAGVLTRKFDPRLPWRAGLLLTAVGLVGQGLYHHDEAQIIVMGCLTSLGAGLVLSCAGILLLGVVSHREQGLASGMSVMLQNLMTALTAQLMFAALNSDRHVLNGTAFYSDNALRNAYFTLAGCMTVALLLSFFIPRVLRPDQIEAGTASEPEPAPAAG
ncbi:MFS transporter [Streptomyces heilongjiangensis]|uniref:MFS transporter n=1 Tax=Streptomyces heilongjiangensis TaxID=945052 RepID=A0ABW1BK86_9ACTN|nr:MFS transporter [Streptomyces heilongjiangensis]MDC2951967.1 MFS transporter [Streptomyces heilongjiangensis]